MFSLTDIIDIAIKIEKNGERVYREAQAKVSDKALKAMFAWLADQEQAHVEWFSQMKNTIPAKEVDSALAEMGRNMLENVVGDQCFSLDEVDFSKMDSLVKVIETAIELENDTVLFYNMLGGFVQETETLVALQKIIEEEQKHGQTLGEFLSTGTYSTSPPPA